jgi:hypothetical protein
MTRSAGNLTFTAEPPFAARSCVRRSAVARGKITLTIGLPLFYWELTIKRPDASMISGQASRPASEPASERRFYEVVAFGPIDRFPPPPICCYVASLVSLFNRIILPSRVTGALAHGGLEHRLMRWSPSARRS